MDESDFEIATEHGSIKFSEVTPEEWKIIKGICREIINEKLVSEVSKAYILAFWRFANYKLTLLQPFDQNYDIKH